MNEELSINPWGSDKFKDKRLFDTTLSETGVDQVRVRVRVRVPYSNQSSAPVTLILTLTRRKN
jgi:hypothetical protein